MKINDLCVRYNDKQILGGVSLDIEKGERIAIVGKSGEGKTTLLKAVASLIPYEGEVLGVGKSAFVFQTDKLITELSAKENLLMVNPDCDADKLLSDMGLGSKINAQVKALSGGMSRRVAFARAFAYGAETVLADEPFSGLDISTKCDIIKKVKEMLEGKTLLLVTHDLFEARSLCDKTVVLSSGKIVRIFEHSKQSEEEMLNFLQNL